jgi:hypothetical protein
MLYHNEAVNDWCGVKMEERSAFYHVQILSSLDRVDPNSPFCATKVGILEYLGHALSGKGFLVQGNTILEIQDHNIEIQTQSLRIHKTIVR